MSPLAPGCFVLLQHALKPSAAPLAHLCHTMSNFHDHEIHRFKESLRRRDKVILEQAQEIAELKQKLLRRAATSAQQSTKCKNKSNTAETDLLVLGFSNIKMSYKMNPKAVMSFGLEMVGVGAKGQNVQDKINMQHFRSHFGIGPEAIIDIIADMKNGKRDTLLSHLMMTLCWLKLYETKHVMSGRWGFDEEFCRDTVKHITTRRQCLKAKKIKFGPFDSKRIYLGTVDCVHCETNEFRTDPNSKWYSHKHNGAGVLYEVVVDSCRDKAGPKPDSTHDINFFCGGTQVSTN